MDRDLGKHNPILNSILDKLHQLDDKYYCLLNAIYWKRGPQDNEEPCNPGSATAKEDHMPLAGANPQHPISLAENDN